MDDLLIQNIANYLGYTKEQCIAISNKAPKTYRHYKIPKKTSGLRTIHHPSKTTKALQYAIMETFLQKFPVHDCAWGYKRNIKSPIQQNAMQHANFRYSVKIDFKDFFHSISHSDLFFLIEKNNNVEHLSPTDFEFLKNCLFIKTKKGNKGLAIGAPSSPLISNIVMYEFDENALRIAHSINNKSTYTRYADDIVFSVDKKGDCSRFLGKITHFINDLEHPSLIINDKKTVFCSKGTRRVITGIFVTSDGKTSIGRKNKRYIKKLLFDYSRNAIEENEMKYLSGYLSFILDVEPDFFNRLAIKYGGDIVSGALNFY